MRAAILITSTCVALFFAVSFLLTFFAKPYIAGFAQDYVADRTQRFVEPGVEIAEKALQSPGIDKVLDDEMIQVSRQEIADYRRDSRAYIGRLVAEKPVPLPDAAPARNGPLKERVSHWKVQIREHFDRTLNRLLWDMRIFCGSNAVAALLAAWCARRAREKHLNWLLGVAGLLLVSMAYGVYMYVDRLTYFRILFNMYIGWWYPILLAINFGGLYLGSGRRKQFPPGGN